MKIFSLFIVFLLSFFITTNSYSTTLESLQERFRQYPTIKANFKQERHIKGINVPLISTGKMIISKELGLWWKQEIPFSMTIKMNKQRMEQSVMNQPSQIITAESQPQLFQFNYLLTAIFNADKEILNNHFSIDLSENDDEWTIDLKPKLSPLNKIFNQISIRGKEYLTLINISDKQNDKTIIIFDQHNVTPLDKNEEKLFY